MPHDPVLSTAETILEKITMGNFHPRAEAYGDQTKDMINLEGWRIVGWTFASDLGFVKGDSGVKFACLFEQTETNAKRWCVIGAIEFRALAQRKLDQDKLAKK